MHRIDKKFRYSPSDLVSFLGCNHSTFEDYKALSDGYPIPGIEDDTYESLIINKGIEHEKECLEKFKSEGFTVVEIPVEEPVEIRASLTISAIHSGVDVIYQAVFLDNPWVGYADFLVLSDTHSELGEFSYEIYDTKLAKTPKTEHIIQLCSYSELLSNVQGVLPEKMHIILGDNTHSSFLVSDYYSYYKQCKVQFEKFMSDIPDHSYPEPCSHCDTCQWNTSCSLKWEQDNHLSLISNITRSQRDKIRKAGIHTVEDFSQLDTDISIADLNENVRSRLQSQARLQTLRAKTEEDTFELIEHTEGRGFWRMPKPSAGDLFFDIEGDPLYPNGLEYLFGVLYMGDTSQVYKDWWSHDHAEEKESFISFMEFLAQHMSDHPDAHIYHYNHYETTALKKLASRYATHEEQIDNLLRQHKFVDLYNVARESIRTSEPGFSLKNLETFYMEDRDTTIDNGELSVLWYNKWIESEDPTILEDIRDYNKLDCESTYLLREWLISLRPQDLIWYQYDSSPAIERKDWEIQYEDYKVQLSQIENNYVGISQTVSDLLEFHRREAKVEWWEMYARQEKYPDELIDDLDCLAGLSLISEPVKDKRSLIYTYKFPSQEFRLRQNDKVMDVETLDYAGQIWNLDEDTCTIKLRIGIKSELPESLCIGPPAPFSTQVIRLALYDFADSVIAGDDRYRALKDLLALSIPSIKNKEPGETIAKDTDLFNETKSAVENLDNSYLFIQGPPGTGKTYSNSSIIVELIKSGKKVGVASNSHKAIHNMLETIEDIATREGYKFNGIKKSTEGLPETYFDSDSFTSLAERSEVLTVLELTDSPNLDDGGGSAMPTPRFLLSRISDKYELKPKVFATLNSGDYSGHSIDRLLGVNLIAGTTWLFSHVGFREKLDYLFLDEAGQVSLANLVAMGTAAKNIVLIGDQSQLAMPLKGTHPGDAGSSVLEFLLKDQATISSDRGIFLNQTWRLNSDICRFISKSFYDNRLTSNHITDKRLLLHHNDTVPSDGIVLVSCDHNGCIQRSEEEGIIVRDIYKDFIGTELQDVDGVRIIGDQDILVVTPYNIQVNHLKSILPNGARVGTVDRFQGQEAPIVIVSMVTSTVEDIPRNMEFLYSKNRLNVALSRAQCLSVVVLNPKLLEASCKTTEQMNLINTFCYLKEYCEEAVK